MSRRSRRAGFVVGLTRRSGRRVWSGITPHPTLPHKGGGLWLPYPFSTASATFSAHMMVGMFVLARGTAGNRDASHTRKRSTP